MIQYISDMSQYIINFIKNLFLRSNNMSKHHVKIYKWIEGVLVVNDYEFDTYEIAIGWINGVTFDSVKIFNEFGELVYSGNFIDIDLYAYC